MTVDSCVHSKSSNSHVDSNAADFGVSPAWERKMDMLIPGFLDVTKSLQRCDLKISWWVKIFTLMHNHFNPVYTIFAVWQWTVSNRKMISKWELGDIRSISGCFRIRQDIICPKSKGYTVAGDFTGISWSQVHTLVIFSDMSTNKNCDMPANLQRMSLRALVPVSEHEKVSNAACNEIPMPLSLLVFILLIRCTTNILASFVPFPVTICAACVVRLAASESFPINVFTLPVKRWKVLSRLVNWLWGYGEVT